MQAESAFRLTLSRFAVQGLKHVRWCVCQYAKQTWVYLKKSPLVHLDSAFSNFSMLVWAIIWAFELCEKVWEMNSLPVCSRGKITISERREEKGSKLSFKTGRLICVWIAKMLQTRVHLINEHEFLWEERMLKHILNKYINKQIKQLECFYHTKSFSLVHILTHPNKNVSYRFNSCDLNSFFVKPHFYEL